MNQIRSVTARRATGRAELSANPVMGGQDEYVRDREPISLSCS